MDSLEPIRPAHKLGNIPELSRYFPDELRPASIIGTPTQFPRSPMTPSSVLKVDLDAALSVLSRGFDPASKFPDEASRERENSRLIA